MNPETSILVSVLALIYINMGNWFVHTGLKSLHAILVIIISIFLYHQIILKTKYNQHHGSTLKVKDILQIYTNVNIFVSNIVII